ncbi:hypothetical protein IC582_027087 [Cucumis melo]
MFLVRLEQFEPLIDATSLLAQVAKDADVKFTPLMLMIIVSNRSPRFVATLQLSRRLFTNFSVDHNKSSKVSLQPFHDAMLDGGSFSSMTIHLLDTTNQMVLRFETPSHDVPPLHHELALSPPQAENLGQVEYGNFFTVTSRELRRIIKELPLFHQDTVSVTVTGSQVKFSIQSKEIILTKEGGHCKIVGYEGEVETKLQVVLRPMMFFLNFTYRANKVWFYKTITNSHSVMSTPAFGTYGQYVIYFPQL